MLPLTTHRTQKFKYRIRWNVLNRRGKKKGMYCANTWQAEGVDHVTHPVPTTTTSPLPTLPWSSGPSVVSLPWLSCCWNWRFSRAPLPRFVLCAEGAHNPSRGSAAVPTCRHHASPPLHAWDGANRRRSGALQLAICAGSRGRPAFCTGKPGGGVGFRPRRFGRYGMHWRGGHRCEEERE